MDPSELNHYFELALDLPHKEREEMFGRLEELDPEAVVQLRDLLARDTVNLDFATRTGIAAVTRAEPRDLDRVTRIIVPTKDVARAVAFYREQFECVIDELAEKRAVLRFANVALVLERTKRAQLVMERADEGGELRDPGGNPISVVTRAARDGPPAP